MVGNGEERLAKLSEHLFVTEIVEILQGRAVFGV